MSRNGTGKYTLPTPPGLPSNGQTISAPDYGTTLTDIANALTGSVAADGQTPITGDFNWSGKNITNIGTVAATAAAFTDAATSGGMTVGNVLTVTKGGADITGDTTITGALDGLTGLTIASGGAAITGTITLAGGLDATGNITAAAATKTGQATIYDQFATTAAATGQVALPTGLVIKWGTGTYTAGAGSVSYGSAFATATLAVQITLVTSAAPHTSYPVGVDSASYATTGFTVSGGTGQSGSFNWLAIGH